MLAGVVEGGLLHPPACLPEGREVLRLTTFPSASVVALTLPR